MAADLAEILALIMSSKSAQFEFCVSESQKSWLGRFRDIDLHYFHVFPNFLLLLGHDKITYIHFPFVCDFVRAFRKRLITRF